MRGLRPYLTCAVALVIWALLNCQVAQADIGGNIPGPGLCDYPATGYSHMVMNEYEYECDFPTEENGSHHHCEWGGGSVDVNGGVSIFMFNAGVSGHVGAVAGSCSWRCPDGSLAAPPNPPGAWKNRLIASRCVAVGPNPDLPPPPPGEPPPELPPAPPTPLTIPWRPGMRPPGPTDPGLMPDVTNPVAPNPDETVNPPEER